MFIQKSRKEILSESASFVKTTECIKVTFKFGRSSSYINAISISRNRTVMIYSHNKRIKVNTLENPCFKLIPFLY